MAFAGAALGLGLKQGTAAIEDPVGYFVRVSRAVGSAFLVAGAGMGVAAYYLKASATSAANNELNVIGNIGTIFSNIQAPTFSPAPTGTAPLSWTTQGVQNFFGDAWSDVQAAGADVAQIGSVIGTLGEDVGIAVTDVAKGMLAFVMHFPDILWNGLVWGVGGSIADVLTWAFPWLLIIGGALLVASFVAQGLRALWVSTAGAAFTESYNEWAGRARAKAKARFDRIFRNESPGLIDAGGPAEAQQTEPEAVPGAASAAVSVPPPEPAPAPALSTPPETSTKTPPPEDETPPGWTTEQTQEYLGAARESERDALKAQGAPA